MDIVDAGTRSAMMAAIRGKDTKPELVIRSALHSAGFRYRLHRKDLPGRPDLVFPGPRAVLFVHGCFWHRHLCPMFRWPATREAFWRNKLDGNAARDQAQQRALSEDGWRIGVVWECALKGRGRLPLPQVVGTLTTWIRSDGPSLEIRGSAP